MMKTKLLSILFILAIIGCNKNPHDKSIVPDIGMEEMVDIMTKVKLMNSLVNQYPPGQRDSIRDMYTQQIYHDHDLKDSVFKANLAIYSDNTELQIELSENILNKLVVMQQTDSIRPND